jgi:hypothetical protein
MSSSIARLLLSVLLLGVISACGDAAPGGGEAAVSGSPEEVTFAPNLNVDLANMEQTPSGLRYEDIREGEGAVATPGNLATVHSTGWWTFSDLRDAMSD